MKPRYKDLAEQEAHAKVIRKELREEMGDLVGRYAEATEGRVSVQGYVSMYYDSDTPRSTEYGCVTPLDDRLVLVGKALVDLKLLHPKQYTAIEYAFIRFGITDEIREKKFRSLGNYRHARSLALDFLVAFFAARDRSFQSKISGGVRK